MEYIYNDEGIRVQADSYDQPTGGGAKSNEKTVTYLVDSYNHTGYARVLEEWAVEGGTATLTCYTLGDDVIAQKKTYWQWVDSQWELQSTGNAQYLLYDGHGSTRQLAEYDTEVSIADSFSYDGYGVLLQDEDNFPPEGTQVPGKVDTQATSLLYAGEHFDTDMQHYYNRARWYSPSNGRFNRMDPYEGNRQDPQSLHKYLYAHCNPINNIDPTGMMDFSFGGLTINMSIRGILQAIPALPTAAYMWAGTHMALITSVSFYAMLTFIASTLWVGLEEQGHVPEISVVGDWTVAKGLQVISGATFFLGLIIINTIPDLEKVRIANKIQKRCYELQQQLGRSSGFGTTMSVGVAKGPGGDYVTLISTSEKGFYLRPGVTQMGNEIMVTGSGHAEVQIVDFCRQQNMHLLAVGASIDVCTECAPVITGAGADIVTPIEGERLINH